MMRRCCLSHTSTIAYPLFPFSSLTVPIFISPRIKEIIMNAVHITIKAMPTMALKVSMNLNIGCNAANIESPLFVYLFG